jgi:hypothetical protein
MTESAWYWADHDGTPKATTIAALRATLSLSALPPFVLVWHTGLSEWLPAYLIAELAKILGVEAAEAGALDPSITEPPAAPVEWYVECYGGTPPGSLASPSAGLSKTANMNTGDKFDPNLMKTVLGRNKPLPIAAFRSVDDYLTHIRKLRGSDE